MTPFTTLGADMNVGRLNLDGIQLDSPVLRVNGKGFIGFDQALNFELVAHTSGGGASQGVKQVAAGGQGGGIPLTVTGNRGVPASSDQRG